MPASWAASALVVLVLTSACAGAGSAAPREHAEGTTQAAAPRAGLAVATFAGGCFWCMEPPFEALPGVLSVTSGYTGAEFPHPTYQQVSSGGTGHAEAVRVVFDPATIGYERLLDVFWRNVDPLAVDRQFCDAGTQYRSAIFVHDEAQRAAAERSKRELASSGRLRGPIATEIAPAGPFWVAEEEHQDYSRKNPTSYRLYRSGCGRDRRLAELWGEAPTAH